MYRQTLIMPRMFRRTARSLGRFGLLALLLLAGTAGLAAAAPLGVATIVQGDVTLMRDAGKFALSEGVRLQAEDIIEFGPQARLVSIEFSDGAMLYLGAGSRVLLAPHLAGDRSKARAYLLAGWAKLVAPTGVDAMLASPLADLGGHDARVVLGLVSADRAQVFAEHGEWQLHSAAGNTALKQGDFATVGTRGKPETAARPTPDFFQALPRPFMDTLPARAKLFEAVNPTPKPLAPITYADAQPWIDAETALRRGELARWRPLSRDPGFRDGLIADLKTHPEWEPVLFPPAPAPSTRKP